MGQRDCITVSKVGEMYVDVVNGERGVYFQNAKKMMNKRKSLQNENK